MRAGWRRALQTITPNEMGAVGGFEKKSDSF